MLHAGLDLSRMRLDFDVRDADGALVEAGATTPDAAGLARLVQRVARYRQPVYAAIESMTGARFVHDQLERLGWTVAIADALKVKGLAPLACKTDRIDAHVLAELSRRALVPAIWLPDPTVRAERERARFRLYLVKQRTRLKQRIHAARLAHGIPCPVSDLFGVRGRAVLVTRDVPAPCRAHIETAVVLVDELTRHIDARRLDCAVGSNFHGCSLGLLPGPRQLDQPAPELFGIRRMGLRYRELLFPRRDPGPGKRGHFRSPCGCHENGAFAGSCVPSPSSATESRPHH